ncbi:hypothetical protein TNCV_3980871 [Trichonephila clavipes]|nr:hypothetical protein TNCV_3980871 [Trichonephila clavipes]
MRDLSVKTTSFHSAAHILLSSHHWRWRHLWFWVKGRPNNGRLAFDHSAVNGVEWYAQTLNDALQTQCAVLRYVLVERGITYPTILHPSTPVTTMSP